MKKIIVLSIMSILLLACEPTEKKEKRLKQAAEDKRIDCLDRVCDNDTLPEYDYWKFSLLKLNNVWYTAPKTDFNSQRNMAQFNWPIKETGESNLIEMTLFTRPIIPKSDGIIQIAEKNNWILSRKTIKKGLDQVLLSPNFISDDWHYIKGVAYYIATDLKRPDGKPPIAACYYDEPRNGGRFGYHWRDNIYITVRMNQGYCEDFPEIYKKTISLLKNIKRLTP